MTALSIATLCLAGISFYVGALHLLFYLRIKSQKENLSFSLVCFSTALYDLMCTGLYSALSATEGALWQKWQSIALAILALSLLKFISDFMRRKYGTVEKVFVFYFLLQISAILLDNRFITWSNVSSRKHLELFNHGLVTIYEVQPSILVNIQSIIGFLMGIYLARLLINFHRAEKQRGTQPILFAFVILLAAVINDTAVSFGLYQFFYLMEYSFVFLIMAMAYVLASTYLDTCTSLRKRTEELTRLASAVNEAAESIMITDAKGLIQYVNPYFEIMTGYSRNEVIGNNANLFKSGKHNKTFYEKLWNTISDGKIWRGKFINRKKDGSLFEENAVISPIRDSSGTIINYVAVKRDITKETALENQLLQSQKMATIGQLAHKIAHNFTNMLVVILSHSQLAKSKTADSPEIQRHLDEIIRATNQISGLTAELMSLAHPAPLSLKTISLDKAILGIEEILGKTINPDIKWIIKNEPVTGKVQVDPSQIEQVLLHLSINAMEAMPKGGELIIKTGPANLSHDESARLQAGVPENHYHKGEFALITISDTGCGMIKSELMRIFDPFYTTKKEGRNSGLGLTMVYIIISRHNGFITVESQPGVGTTFKIFLPIISNQ